MRHDIKRSKFLLIPMVVAMFFAVSGIVMWLWNALLPEILGVKSISFWQAMGILVLSKILFGGFHGKGWKHREKMEHFKRHDAFSNMTDEEKQKLREAWKNRCDGNFFKGNC